MKNKKKIIIGLILLLASLTFYFRSEILEYVNFLEVYVEESPFVSAVILLSIQALLACLVFPGAPMTILIGGFYGPYWGTLIALIGNTLGAVLAFILARYLFRDFVTKKILPKYPKAKKYDEKILRNPLKTVLWLRLNLIVPFNVKNYVMGLTAIKMSDYFIGTVFGMIPGIFIFTALGGSLRAMNLLTVTALLVVIAFLIYIFNKFPNKKSQDKMSKIYTEN